MLLLIDSNVLGQLCHPTGSGNREVVDWVTGICHRHSQSVQFCVPEIADYELRRELLRMIRSRQSTTRSIRRLDDLIETLQFVPISTPILRRAAELWAEARASGRPTASAAALDADVILAATAIEISGVVLTENRKHLSRYAIARTWRELGDHPFDIRPCRPGEPPSYGFTLGRDLPQGHLYWVSVNRIPVSNAQALSLPVKLVERLAAVYAVLEDVLPRSFDDTLRDLQGSPNPNAELSDWEHYSRVYEGELRERPTASHTERQRLFDTLMFIAATNSIDELLEVFPNAGLLGHLERIHQQMSPRNPKH
jgi:predicted nucleic acid-binding protein